MSDSSSLGWRVMVWCFEYVMPWFLLALLVGCIVGAIFCLGKALLALFGRLP